MYTFERTQLWNAISSTSANRIQADTVRQSLSKAELVLRSAGTTPVDFTLHDDEHGYRVAERCAELIFTDPELAITPNELALLLMSAYIHDIGMSPSRDAVSKHWKYLLTGKLGILEPVEESSFQGWLDTDADGLTPPIAVGEHSIDGLDRAEQLIAYYTRRRHNDWSEDWISSNLSNIDVGLYAGWQSDLIRLCRSHHEGIDTLRGRDFDIRIVGNPGSALNLRYLAIVLRVADVMEFDPERTPDVVLQHRGIVAKSRIFWYKDRQIGFRVDSSEQRFILTARTPNAVIHKAVLDTANDVNQELALANTLLQEGYLRRGIASEADMRRYDWKWPARLTVDVAEDSKSFVYIDGAFRPAPARVIQLLAGTALYRTPFAALRELLQNAFDAVREQIAYERLREPNPGEEATLARVASRHKVRLKFETSAGQVWVVCSDDGTGMTRDMIEKSFLVSGSAPRGSLKSLERDANRNGFSVDRTGEFGIGVLSYFMISDYLELVTRRGTDSYESDPDAWSFGISGLGSFGELRKVSRGTRGTELRLRINPSMNEDGWENFVVEANNYIISTLSWLPCELDLIDQVGSLGQKNFSSGWANRIGPKSESSVASDTLLRGSAGLVSAMQKAQRENLNTQRLRFISSAEKALKWEVSEEFQFENGTGVGRVHLPLFEIEAGYCAAYASVNQGFFDALRDHNFLLPRNRERISWRGFSISGTGTNQQHRRRPICEACSTELDFRKGRQINVSREDFVESGDASVREEVASACSELVKSSCYNQVLSGR